MSKVSIKLPFFNPYLINVATIGRFSLCLSQKGDPLYTFLDKLCFRELIEFFEVKSSWAKRIHRYGFHYNFYCHFAFNSLGTE